MDDKIITSRPTGENFLQRESGESPGELVVIGENDTLEIQRNALDAIRYGRVDPKQAASMMAEGLQSIVQRSAERKLNPNEVAKVVKQMMAVDTTAKDGYPNFKEALQQVGDGIRVITDNLPIEMMVRLGMCDINYCSPRRLVSYIRHMASLYQRTVFSYRKAGDNYAKELAYGSMCDVRERCLTFVEVMEQRKHVDKLAEDIVDIFYKNGETPSRQVRRFIFKFSDESALFTRIIELIEEKRESLGNEGDFDYEDYEDYEGLGTERIY